VEVLCESCGVANPAGVEFCMFCGAYLDWTDRESGIDTQTSPAVREGRTPEPTARVARVSAGAGSGDDEPVVIPSLRTAAPVLLDQAAPVRPAPAPAFVPAVPGASTCPSCGRPNEAHLHFCARCGQVLREEPPAPAASQAPGWRRMVEDRDRSARRAYRRSLPPLYRWRRVAIAVLVPALLLGGLVATGRHPVRWVQERWWDLRGTTVAVSGISAATSPGSASLAGSDPASLVDGTEQAWSEPWNPAKEGDSCGGAPGTGTVVLTFPATRVREIDLNAGLPASNAKRPLELVPQAIGVRFDSGPCRSFTLQSTADLQRLAVDSQVPVSTVSLGVDTTFPGRPDTVRVLSITEVALRSRPS
jgi:hypothetical protein